MTTVREQRERLEAILQTFSTVIDHETVTLTLVPRHEDATQAIADSELPAFFVSRAGRSDHEKDGYGDQYSSRLWLVWIVVAEILPDNPVSSREAEDRAEDLIEPLINFLFDHPRLELDDEPLDKVQGLTIKDDGVKGYQRTGKDYSAVPILIYIGKYRSET